MSFATLSNIATIMFCIAVLVQSVRMMRCLRDMKGDEFGAVVAALDASTAEARSVLAALRETLRTDCTANARVIASGTTMREELTVMTGIADAVAERLVEAVGKSSEARARTASETAKTPQSAKTASAKPQSAKPQSAKPQSAKTASANAASSKPEETADPAPAADTDQAAKPAQAKPRSKPRMRAVQENPA